MPEDRREPTRADLPAEFTPETLRKLPISVLSRLARPGNGILGPEEQASFDGALHELMSGAARRVSGRMTRPDWASVLREANRAKRRAGPGRPSRVDEQLLRLASRLGEQVDLAEGLAPGVDWSFAQPEELSPATSTETTGTSGTTTGTTALTSDETDTVSDLERRLTDQVELVQVMSEIADVSKRTYALEQQRDLQNTRTVFFGFVVSVAVLVAGWAPLVTADDWAERGWIFGLTIATCVIAGVVYALIRRRENAHQSDVEDQREATG